MKTNTTIPSLLFFLAVSAAFVGIAAFNSTAAPSLSLGTYVNEYGEVLQLDKVSGTEVQGILRYEEMPGVLADVSYPASGRILEDGTLDIRVEIDQVVQTMVMSPDKRDGSNVWSADVKACSDCGIEANFDQTFRKL